MRDDAQVDQATLFQAGYHLDRPSCRGLHPRYKCGSIARVAHRRGRNDAHLVHDLRLNGALETLEGPNGVGHRVR